MNEMFGNLVRDTVREGKCFYETTVWDSTNGMG